MSAEIDSKTSDAEYLTRREAQSRAAAASSADPAARMAHATMANRYAEQLKRA